MTMHASHFSFPNSRKEQGFTLIELIVAIGLFALVMLLASGAYLLMIGLNRQAQSIATGIDSLSFAIESMARDMRTGTNYGCGFSGGDCPNGGDRFSFTNAGGTDVSYSLSSGAIQLTTGSVTSTLTDPSVTVSSLTFYVVGTGKNDGQQAHVTVTIAGTVSYAAGKVEPFTVETGATMRGTDL
ncbi:MAG: type II secretion system protein [Candidatus Pacebacteria bacterium]|nr:type II secretion system protein [Candidatus Paceibacterota bacterium]